MHTNTTTLRHFFTLWLSILTFPAFSTPANWSRIFMSHIFSQLSRFASLSHLWAVHTFAARRCAALTKKLLVFLLAQRSDAHRGVRVNGPLEAGMVKLSIPARARVLHRQKFAELEAKQSLSTSRPLPPSPPVNYC